MNFAGMLKRKLSRFLSVGNDIFLIASSVPSKRSLRNVPSADAGSSDMGSKRMDEFSAAPIALAATEAPTLKTANNSRAAGQ